MPTSLVEFGDDTAFERYILDRATPLMPRSQGTSVIELGDPNSTSVSVGLRPATVHVGASDSTRGTGDQLSPDDIRPLLFGAAWKVLDQLIELSLEQAGVSHDRGWNYTITFKVRMAAHQGVPSLPPFQGHPDIWRRSLLTYSSTEVLRNSLVHRRLIVDHSTGAIDGLARPGQPAPITLTADEQSAFCRVAVGIAEAAVKGLLPTRQGRQLAWSLDQLISHHGQPSSGVSSAQGLVPLVIVRPSFVSPDEVTLDFANITNRARAAVGGVSHYDLQIYLPDDRVLAGPLEDAPQGQVTVHTANPPGWLQWV
jgi:hypothetical protein